MYTSRHGHEQKRRPKIKNVLIVYSDPNQKLSEVEDSVRKYFYYPNIKILNFLNINDLTEDKARELMPIVGSCTDFLGNTHHYYYLYYDAVVMCTEQKRLRQQMAKTFDLVDYFSRTHYIRYSTIRHTLNCRKGLF